MSAKKAWSFSGIKDFDGCPRRYHRVKVLKQHPFVDNDATRYGKVVHTACEEYIRDGKPLAEGLGKFQPMLDKLCAMPGDKFCELEMALDETLAPTTFMGSNVWVRGIIDLLIVNGDKARIIDYKSGKAKYPDKDQLELMALMTFEYFPKVNEIKGALLFMNHDVLVKAAYKRDNKVKLWDKWKAKSSILDKAFETDTWHPKPTGLCKAYCPVIDCEFNGKNK